MTVFVHAHFENRSQADTAVKALLEAHVAADKVRVITRQGSSAQPSAPSYRTRIGRSALWGICLGAPVGLFLSATGWLPGLADVASWAAVQGSVIGAAAGLFIGAVRGRGWWEQRPALHPDDVDAAGVIVGVSISAERAPAAREALLQSGGEDVGVADAGEVDAAVRLLHVRGRARPGQSELDSGLMTASCSHASEI